MTEKKNRSVRSYNLYGYRVDESRRLDENTILYHTAVHLHTRTRVTTS